MRVYLLLLDWCLSVRYTHDKVTDAIGCNQEANVDHLLVKYANACPLPMNPGTDLDLLPTQDASQDCRTCLRCSDW